jgi:hypothetical protein
MGMQTLGVTEIRGQADLDRIASDHDTLIVEFGSRPSDALLEVASERTQNHFVHVDPAASPAIAAMFGLSEGPALLILRQKVVLYFDQVEHTAAEIGTLLERVGALDMDTVHRALQAEREAEEALMMRRVCPATRRGRVGE